MLGVKDSLDGPPDIDAVRPAQCPGCAAASRPVGESIVIIGHGVRRRGLVWKSGVGNVIHELELSVRRFLCRACGVTITVLPCVVMGGIRYALDAIAFCLGTWFAGDATAAELRELFCDEPHIDWPQLRRWAMRIRLPEGRRPGRGPPKRHAGRVAQIYAGCAPPQSREGLTLAQRAFLGAAYVR